MKSYIKAISYYLPQNRLSNEQLISEFPEWTAEKISEKTGIYNRFISGEDEFSSDMAFSAANLLFEEHKISKNEIDFILLCTQSPDYFLPTTACILQEKLGLPTSCGAIDFNLGCSGYVYGLSLAKGLVSSGISKNVLLITSETYSKFISNNDKSNRSIFGDGAAATLVSSSGFAEIGEFVLGTDGRGANNLIVKKGGLRSRKGTKSLTSQDSTCEVNDFNFYMNGSEIFNFTIESVPGLVYNTIVKNDLKFENINLFLFHQANKFILNHLRRKIGISESKFYFFLSDCGNTVSSTIPIALYNALKDNKVQGDVLIAGFGVGYSWGATVLKF